MLLGLSSRISSCCEIKPDESRPPISSSCQGLEEKAHADEPVYSPSRPTWLELTHKKLDEAVFAAYGWPSDLSDEEILERLLALNLERAGKG